MRKILTAVLILTLIVLASITEQKAVTRISEEFTSKLNDIRESMMTGDAEDEILDFEKSWQEGEKILDILTPHDDTDEINLKLSEFKSFLEAGCNDMAIKSINEMKQHFKEIQKKTEITLTNIF